MFTRMKRFTLAFMAVLCCLMGHATVESVDDLVGVYSVKATGTESVTDYTSAADMSKKSYYVEIDKNSDGTVTITNLLNFGSTLIGTVDLNEKTITIAPGLVSWATFASSKTPDGTGNVVAEFTENGGIEVYDFGAWYSETNYISDDAELKLAKTDITKDWTAEGIISYSNAINDDWTEYEYYHTGSTTLSKYSGCDDYDYILKCDYAYASPNSIKFKVKDGYITITNGTQYTGYSGAYFYNIYPNNSCAWLDTTKGYATFSGDKDGGEMYIYCKDYDTNDSVIHTGYLSFLWGTLNGIAAPTAAKAAKTAPIYDLSGRKVAHPSAGIYIQNGKKFVVK